MTAADWPMDVEAGDEPDAPIAYELTPAGAWFDLAVAMPEEDEPGVGP